MTRVGSRLVAAPLLVGFGAVACGTALADGLACSAEAAALLVVLALLAASTAARRQQGGFVAALGVLATLGALAAATTTVPPPPAPGCGGGSFRATVTRVTGRAFGPRGDLVRPVLLALEAERCGHRWEPRAGVVSTRLAGDGPLATGDRLEVALDLEPLPPRRNPTDPDPTLPARRDGVAGRAHARSPAAVLDAAPGALAWLDRQRDATGARFEAALARPLAAVAKALSSGDQAGVDDAQRERWSASGLSHLLSVSGLHVSLVAALCFWLARVAAGRLPGAGERWPLRRGAALVAVPPVVLFCLWAGAPAAAVRATVMGTAFLAGLALGRPSAVLNACGLAGTLILLSSPASLYDPGFLLSFVAILFLLLVPASVPGAGRLARMARAARGLVVASCVATAATAPVTAWFFGRVSLAGPLVNLAGVPLGSAVATPLALAHTLLAPVAPSLARAVAAPLSLSLAALEALATWASALPWASVDVPQPSVLEVVAFYAGLLALLLVPGRRRWHVVVTAATVVTVSVASRTFVEAHTRELVVVHPYVGQGDATLLRLPDGESVLVDAGGATQQGGPDPGQRVVAPLLRRRGVRALDLAVVTHPHPDHLGGFAYVVTHFPIRELWWSGRGGEEPAMRAVLAAVARGGGVARVVGSLPARLERGGVGWELLHPRASARTEGLPCDPELSENDCSVVLRLSYGRRHLLLPGDVEAEAEHRLAASLGPVDLLKSPHHGSATSSSPALLAITRPRLVVISLGDHNPFGFPDEGVLSRYRAAGAVVLRTDRDGLVEAHTDGDRLWIRTATGLALEL